MSRILCFISILFLCSSPLFAQEQEDEVLGRIDSLYSQAYQFIHIARYDEAIEALIQGRRLASDLANLDKIVESDDIFATLNTERNRHKDVLRYLGSVERELREVERLVPLLRVLSRKTQTLLTLGEREKAEEVLEEAKEIIEYEDVEEDLGMFYYALYLYERDRGQELEAIEQLNKALQSGDKKEGEYFTAKIYLRLSKMYEEQGDREISKNYANEALSISKENNYLYLQVLSMEQLAYLYEIGGQGDQAILFLRARQQVKDSIFSYDDLALERSAKGEYDLDFLERTVERMGQDIIEKDETIKIARITTILSSAFFIVAALLAISLYRNNTIKKNTNFLLYRKAELLEKARENAVTAMHAKAQFLSTVSHELRTPLYAVTGLTHLLLEDNPGAHQEEHLKSLKFSGEYLLSFINDILQINKIEANKVVIRREDFRLDKILNDVSISLSSNAKENNNKMHIDIEESIPGILIGDPLKLSQVLINLVGNALKFTEDGDVWIIVRKLEESEEDMLLSFEVKDSGIGMSAEIQGTIFDSFSQGSVDINRKYGGTGLGLTIVRSMLEVMGSDIRVESKVGEGSSFFFKLVFGKISEESKEEPKSSIVEKEEAILKNVRVLLVDDNKINQVITRKILERKQVSCDIANDGYEAIEMAEMNIYDLILMDIHMPGISGIKSTEEIRKFNDKIPIIALTAVSLEENTEAIYAAGCNDIITKPFKPEFFYRTIAENVEKYFQGV